MQNLCLGLVAQFKSGLSGLPIPQGRSRSEEERLVRWLNDEWPDDPESVFEKAKLGKGPMPDMPNEEDAPARQTILAKFLPLLKKAQTMPNSLEEVMARARQAMKRFPGKYANEEEAANKEGGFAARAELIRMLGNHKTLPMIPTPKQPVKLVVRGDNMTEVWAMYVLLQMASDGVIERLGQCDCGCGKWKIFKRRNDRFFNDACRVRSHQSNPSVKEKRRKEARKRYQQERDGIVATGWKKTRKVAKHVEA
jgi:hypothetical protein